MDYKGRLARIKYNIEPWPLLGYAAEYKDDGLYEAKYDYVFYETGSNSTSARYLVMKEHVVIIPEEQVELFKVIYL